MSWRASWAKAQLVPLLASAMVWLVITPLLPSGVNLLLLLGWVGGVLGRRTRLVLWCRLGARPLTGLAAEQVLRALVPVPDLRGRRQPRVWHSARLPRQVLALSERDLVWSDAVVERIVRGEVIDRHTSALAVHALGLAPAHQSAAVAATEMFTTPWRLATRAISWLPGGRRSVLGRLVWHARWGVLALAAADLYLSGRWVALALLVAASISTVVAPRWQRQWEQRQEQLGDLETIRRGFGPAYAELLARPRANLATLERVAWLRTRVADADPGRETVS